MKKLKSHKLIIVSLIICLLFAGCSLVDTTEAADIEPVESINPSDFTEGTAPVLPTSRAPDLLPESAGSWPEYRLKELMEISSIIVYGRVLRESEPFLIRGPHGARAEAIDFYIEPYEILRGDASLEEIVVRELRFGEWLTVPNEALEIGETYLLFLRSPSGDVLDTPGVYYYAFPFSIIRPLEMQEDGDIVFRHHEFTLLSELREKLVEVNATVPILDDASWRQRELDNIRGNMERDVLVWDEPWLEELENRPLRPARIIEIE